MAQPQSDSVSWSEGERRRLLPWVTTLSVALGIVVVASAIAFFYPSPLRRAGTAPTAVEQLGPFVLLAALVAVFGVGGSLSRILLTSGSVPRIHVADVFWTLALGAGSIAAAQLLAVFARNDAWFWGASIVCGLGEAVYLHWARFKASWRSPYLWLHGVIVSILFAGAYLVFIIVGWRLATLEGFD